MFKKTELNIVSDIEGMFWGVILVLSETPNGNTLLFQQGKDMFSPVSEVPMRSPPTHDFPCLFSHFCEGLVIIWTYRVRNAIEVLGIRGS